jgi:hypothetical protein
LTPTAREIWPEQAHHPDISQDKPQMDAGHHPITDRKQADLCPQQQAVREYNGRSREEARDETQERLRRLTLEKLNAVEAG